MAEGIFKNLIGKKIFVQSAGVFDLVIAFTKQSFEEAYKYSNYSSVLIENWIVDEPVKDENNINQTLWSYRKTRDIIFDKINKRFRGYF